MSAAPSGYGCAACGGHRSAPDIEVPGALRIVVCAACGLGMLWPRPSASELDAAYPEAYYGVDGAKFRLPFEQALRVGGWLEAQRIERRLPPTHRRVLDVGCGRGLVLRALADRGVEVHGFERSRVAAEGADPRIHLRFGEVLEEAGFPARSFGAVTFRHVLEHVGDPLGALRAARELLCDEGWLVVEVPNFGSLQARWAGGRWFHLDPPRHLFHFTEDSLRRMLARAGYEVGEAGHLSLVQDPIGWAQSALHLLGRPRDRLFDGLRGGRRLSLGALGDAAVALGLAPAALGLTGLDAALGRGGTLSLWARRSATPPPAG